GRPAPRLAGGGIMACALLFRSSVEIALQRYSWVATLLAAVLGAYLSARIVNTVAASAIAPKPALLQQSVGASPRAATLPPRAELRDREGPRAARQRRAQRIHRQQRVGASEPRPGPDAARPAGRGAEQRRPAALREPVRPRQGDGERRAQRSVQPRHPGAHR